MKTIKVVAAVVTRDGKYLCMQRCRSRESYNSERWEFPGGKVEKDESDHQALIREIKEELDWNIYVGRKIATITHSYSDLTIELTAYWCKGGDEEFTMLEHLDAKWLAADELNSLKWTDADKKIVARILQDSITVTP
ncbi:mutator mutT protein [Hallella bergensis DSM 17361]|uniref:8-oxo-dGTP diphosphatase n=1 Tax=Hallella bergensis DSM 17361 TaxID=585502 RepID=D1PY32_9BACT|nr:(deoxy)nucleoside triphosphate pyrophosphohydrolase [Hallella bergensis]EFA43705.1 mutator mutT protein [Hallella bergensis DSM 17361]